ncbi:MAG: hypothetical protein ACOYB8_02855 [Eubacteriaceae bacterium]|jgi:cobalamin biosynthesis Mg chelatase CobN
MIRNLPAEDKLTAGDKDAADAAQTAFNALTDSQQQLVDSSLVTRLNNAVAQTTLLKIKEDAISELENYKDPVQYSKDGREQLDACITLGKQTIEDATTAEDVQSALKNAKASIDRIATASTNPDDSKKQDSSSGSQGQTTGTDSGTAGATSTTGTDSGTAAAVSGTSANAGTGIEEAYPAYILMLALCAAAAGTLVIVNRKREAQNK